MFVIMSELLSNANSQVANCSNIVKFNNHQNLYTYIVRCQDKTWKKRNETLFQLSIDKNKTDWNLSNYDR